MKKVLFLIILFVQSIEQRAQSLNFQDIFTYQEQVYNLYSQAPNPILDIIDNLFLKGYIVIESTNEAGNINGVTKKGNTFKLKNIRNPEINEIISFSTIEILAPQSNVNTLAFTTRVETSDFEQYLKWYNDIKNSQNFILQTRSDGMYTFIQNVNKTRLFLRPDFSLSGNSIKIKEPIKYVYEFTLSN